MGANKLKDAPATNIFWKSFILPHTEVTLIRGASLLYRELQISKELKALSRSNFLYNQVFEVEIIQIIFLLMGT